MFKYQIIQLTTCQFIGFPALGRIMEKLIWDLISEDTEDSNAFIIFVSMALWIIGLIRHLIKGNLLALCINIPKHLSNAFNSIEQCIGQQ